jgi:GAF domain-containing protein
MSNPASFVQRETQRLKEENRELQDEVSNLRAFVAALNQLYESLDHFEDDSALLPLLRGLLAQALILLNAPDGSLVLLDEDTNELVFVIVTGKLSDTLTDHRIPADEGIMGWVVNNRQPTLVRDVKRDIRFSNRVDTDFTFSTQSIIAAPLIGDGKVFGAIEALNQPGDVPFSENDVALLTLLCRAAGQALAYIDRLPEKS